MGNAKNIVFIRNPFCIMKKIIFLLFLTLVNAAFVFSQPAPCVVWQKCLGNTLGDNGVSVTATSDGGFIALSDAQQVPGFPASNTNSFNDVWITKWGPDFNLQWQQCYAGRSQEVAMKIIEVSTGGYLVMGTSSSFDFEGMQNLRDFDIFLSRLDINGNKLWTKLYGGRFWEGLGILGQGGTSAPGDVVENPGGGFTFVTSTASTDGDVTGNISTGTFFDIWVVTVNDTGKIIWNKCYGGTASDEGYGITRTGDGGYIVAAKTSSNDVQVTGNHGDGDLWVFKIDATGTLLWQKALGGSSLENYFSPGGGSGIDRGNILTASDGSVYILCNTQSFNGDVSGNHGISDNWIVKMNSSGVVLWSKCYGGSGNENQGKMIEDTDGNIVYCGSSTSADGDLPGNYGSSDVFVAKINHNNGNIIWIKNYGGTSRDGGADITRLSQKGFILIGATRSNDMDVSGNNGQTDIWIANLDTPAVLSAPVANNLLPVYCATQTPVSIRLANNPPAQLRVCNGPANTLVTVLLDNSVNLPVAADSTFTLNFQNLATGNHTLVITYQAGASTTSATFGFTVTAGVTPATDLTAAPANGAGIIQFSAVNISGGGTTPLFTFAADRNFTSIIQSESASATASQLNTTFPVGINWVYVRLKTSESCNTQLFDVDSVMIPIPDLPQVSAISNEYCSNAVAQTISILNIPSAVYQSVTSVKLDNNTLPLNGNQFVLNIPALTAGVHQLEIKFTNNYITQTKAVSFNIKTAVTPATDLTAAPANGAGIIQFSAVNISGGGATPLFTFAADRNFTSIIQPESASATASQLNTTFPVGINWVYVRLKTSESCNTQLFDVDSVMIPIPDLPQVSAISNEYCSNAVAQTISILNTPSAVYQSVTSVKLDNNTLPLNGNQFVLNIPVLTAGVHQLEIKFTNNYIAQTKTVSFNIKTAVNPAVDLVSSAGTVNYNNAALTLTAQPLGAGSNPLYLFSKDHLFTQPLAAESATNTVSISPAALVPGLNILYVRIRSTEPCRTSEFATDSVAVWKNGSLLVTVPGSTTPLSVYPNPVNNYIFISGLQASGTYTIRLSDMNGKKVKVFRVENQQVFSIPVRNLSTGIYLLSVFSHSANKTLGTVHILKN